MQIDFAHSLVGFLVGTLVGLTGVGGGSLMAPITLLQRQPWRLRPSSGTGSHIKQRKQTEVARFV